MLARQYHEPPSTQHRLSLRQFRTIQADYYRALQEQQEAG